MYCMGQVQMEVQSVDDVLDLMRKAQQFREIGETKINKNLSTSHCIFTLQVNANKLVNN